MPAQADIKVLGNAVGSVIFDGVFKTNSATVASDIVLSANGVNSEGIAEYCDRSGGITVGFPRFTLSVRKPTKVSRNYKVSAKLFVPRLATTSPSTNTGIEPAPTKAYEMQAHLDFILPERSTSAERTKLLYMLESLFAATITASDGAPSDTTGTPLGAAVVNLDPVY